MKVARTFNLDIDLYRLADNLLSDYRDNNFKTKTQKNKFDRLIQYYINKLIFLRYHTQDGVIEDILGGGIKQFFKALESDIQNGVNIQIIQHKIDIHFNPELHNR